MKTMQKFFMMLTVVLMAGFMTSCGSDDDNNVGPLGTYTVGMTISDQGGLSDMEVSMMNQVLKNMEQTFKNVSESRAKSAFEESFRGIDTSKLDTSKDYTLEYYLKDGNGTKIASHYVIIKNGKITIQ
jgi:hypothetical protein